MDTLARKTIVGLAQFIASLGVFLFAPAWTLNFLRGRIGQETQGHVSTGNKVSLCYKDFG
jgi:hypothetical protein